MANNYLITGYWGEPHVTAENDRGINAGIFGTGRFVLPVGEQFNAEYVGNNTIRLYDGKLLDNGAAAGIPAGEFVDFLISGASQGMKRNDLIVFQYEQDASTMVESGTFVVVEGTETDGTAADPDLSQSDLLSNKAVFDQFALWRVPVSGATISAPVQLFTVSKSLANVGDGDYIETSEKGAAGGVASLGSDGLVPANQLPELTGDYIETSEKGAANGVASLGSNGKVPSSQLPDIEEETSNSSTTVSVSCSQASAVSMTGCRYFRAGKLAILYGSLSLTASTNATVLQIKISGLPDSVQNSAPALAVRGYRNSSFSTEISYIFAETDSSGDIVVNVTFDSAISSGDKIYSMQLNVIYGLS